MGKTKAGTVEETGAGAGDVLVGIEPRNRNLQIRVDADQPADGRRVKGSFEVLDAGNGTYSEFIRVGSYTNAAELIREVREVASNPKAAKCRHVLNRNGLRVRAPDE